MPFVLDTFSALPEIIEDYASHVSMYAGGELSDEGFMSQCPYIAHGMRWRTGWIPIVGAEEGTAYVDTCPSDLGVKGQIVLIDVPSDVCRVIATDVVDLLRRSLSFPTDNVLIQWPSIDPRTGGNVEATNFFE